MYGGVSKTYCLWKLEGEPYKKGKYLYVKVKHPVTGLPKEVRWYTDKAHADLMPNKMPAQFPGKVFGFESADDYILAINQRHLTEQELSEYFHACWQKGRNWRFGMFFNGIWYAPKTEPIPPISKADKVCKVGWADFVKAARAHGDRIGAGKDSFWYRQEV